jgi:hypothetical protein
LGSATNFTIDPVQNDDTKAILKSTASVAPGIYSLKVKATSPYDTNVSYFQGVQITAYDDVDDITINNISQDDASHSRTE